MSDDSAGWYQRKIAALRREQPPASPYPAAYRQPPPVQQPHTPQPVPQQQQPQSPQFDGRVTTENIYEVARFWKGGPAAQTDIDACPRCNSGQYFSRRVSKRGPEPAPHCYNCGYNDGMFDQGLASSWGAG